METGFATPHVQTTPRPLTLQHGSLEHTVLIPNTSFLLATQLRDSFHSTLPTPTEGFDLVEEPSSVTELVARFLGHVAAAAKQETGVYEEVLKTVLAEFEARFLNGNEVHAVATTLPGDAEKHRLVIKNYYLARTLLSKTIKPHPAALFRNNTSSIYAVFGGQGNIEEYFDELRDTYDLYGALVSEFVEYMASVLGKLARDPKAAGVYSKGMDVMTWLNDAESTPELDYMVSAPVSLPLIGVTQLAHYAVACKILGRNPGEFKDYLSGTSGHSQGIITAVAVARSSSWESFYKECAVAVTMLFWIGCRAQQTYPTTALPPSALQDSLGAGEGTPTPMLSIRDLRVKDVQAHIDATNQHLPEDRHIAIALINGPRNVVVTGPPQSLYGLNLRLRKVKAPAGLEQGRVPYSERKQRFVNRFLPISVPFHSKYLQPCEETILSDLQGLDFEGDMTIPVYHTESGADLREFKEVKRELVEMICHQVVNWETATKFPGAKAIIDFGPGGMSGLGALTHRNKDGTGVRVILAGALEGNNAEMGFKPELFDRSEQAVKVAVDWLKEYQPRLVKNKAGRIYVDTPFSRLLGKPPVMVAGMTPSTVPASFISATMNAGYHIELAGGGYYSPAAMTAAVKEIEDNTPPGSGITINIIYINPRTYQWQMPLVKTLRDSGYRIEGVTVAAGIPSIEIANDLVATLGLKHISFKPGSADAIQQVINIAKANPHFPIIMQWTGGRAGGHHSFEDFHAPMLSMYSAVRRCPNIVLVAGSGFGGADDTLPYLTGQWAIDYNHPPMPFDGVLFASRVMTAKEAKTSTGAKQAIVDAPGLVDSEWEKTYKGPAGGVITVRSELGEPIHKLATRGIVFWKEMDDTIFNLPKEKRVAALKVKKDYIIKKLNADYQKVWFGRSETDNQPCDLEDMTYAEVVRRMVELMYVKHQSRWIDKSHRNLTGDFLRRVEERFTHEEGKPSFLQSFEDLNQPFEVVDKFFETYPEAKSQLMNTQDCQHFLTLSQRRGQKPVPFIPILDENFEVWFKKDSLWQSEDLEAVVDQDIGRIAVLQGPMAVKWASKVDEPIAEILDGVHDGHIKSLKELYYNNDESKIPTVEYFGGAVIEEVEQELNDFFTTKEEAGKTIYNLSASSTNGALPEAKKWLELLSGPSYSWRRALLTSDVFVQGTKIQENPMKRIFGPRYGQQVQVADDCIVVSELRNGELVPAAEAKRDGDNISVVMYENRTIDGQVAEMKFLFTYHPEVGYAPIHEVMEGRNDRIKEFYWRLWFGQEKFDIDSKVTDVFEGGKATVQAEAIKEFCHVVGNQSETYVARPGKTVQAPMDFAIVVGWKAITKAIFPKAIDGDLLKLVHLSNGFRMIPGAQPLQAGDEVETNATINAVINNESGKLVEVTGTITRAGEPVMEVVTQFLYRGVFNDFENTFQRTTEKPMEITISSTKDLAVLQSKEWFHLEDDHELLGQTLTFRLNSLVRFRNRTVFSHVETKGQVYLQLPTKEVIQVASVEYEAGVSHGNPVMDYLQRHGRPIEQPVAFENGGYSVTPSPDVLSSLSVAPPSNSPYAQISSDYNPIHVNPYFAKYALLPGTITHGMWSSASCRRFVETFAAENRPERVSYYEVKFLGMVLPNTRLETKLSHTGMMNGRKIIKVETFNQETQEKVLEGVAEVDQAKTAYVCTGQGSQEQGMGMELYDASPVARAIWDRADAHFLANYGFSILNIVRNNPKEFTVHFGGPKGKAIRQNYMSMVYDTVEADGTTKSLPIFKGIDENTSFYTFQHPTGLLSATQFTQPALTLMEKAAFEDMKDKGLVQQGCSFAGHSLGEYSALACIGDVLPIESLIDVVFYRGMTMQVAVARDAEGRSEYGMCAVNPSRISKTLNETALRFIVDHISSQTGRLLEIVNFNVENQQYVAAGELLALDTLANVLNVLKMQKIDLDKLMEQLSIEDVKKHLSEIVAECAKKSEEKKAKNGGVMKPERGFATIPLPGIDVPFHSSFLRNGVKPFRGFLGKKILRTRIDPSNLVGKYIPNVTAKPFQISKEYFEEVYKLTGSPKLGAILKDWEKYENA
ncbi:beta subunit of fatty acid synthetase [Saitoella coloradoensis]